MSLKRHILFIYFCLLSLSSIGQTEAELKVNAEQLFQKELFVDATSLYLRLLSLQPRSVEYNYKYGTCLLFNSNKKEDAIRYLSYAAKDASVDPNAIFFLAKAYHLNYQFNDAITEYLNYQSKVGAKGKYFSDAERNAEMCRNGKKLLSSITEIIVTKKTEIPSSDFFRIYDLSNIGGSIVVAKDFQSKNDKKFNHIPVVHFPVGTDKIFYGSYGENTNLDIYLVRRLPDGKFSLPQLVQGGVNSRFDENYPYLHPTDGYLYFSSKGHNSMGGYDVFRAKYLEESNSFGPAENIDFAISSPDDDIMYMVDKDDKNAYFASARQSQGGKLFVYEVKVDRVPIQLAIVKGKFESGINPENKKMSVEVIDKLTDKNIGKFNTTKDGTYLITFPKGGKYEYRVTVDGSNEKFIALVEIPYLKEFKPLKQKLLHEALDGSEKVRVVNLFNEEVEDAQAIIAQVLKQRSDLNVNVNDFDAKELENAQKTKQVLAELGLSELSLFEVGQLLEQKSNELLSSKNSEKEDKSASNAFVISAVNEINKIDKQIKELVKEADESPSSIVRHSLLKDAQMLADERSLKLKEMNEVQSLQAKIGGDGISETLTKEFASKSAIVQQHIKDGKDIEALKIIASSRETFNEVLKGKENTVTNDLLAKQKLLDKQLASLNESEIGFTKDIDVIEAELRTLVEQKGNVKDKFKEEIQQKIDAKQSQLNEFKGQRDLMRGKQKTLTEERKLVVSELEVIRSIENYTGAKVTDTQVNEAKKSLNNENAKTIDEYIDTQLAEIIKNNPSLANSLGKISESEKIIAVYASKSEKLIGSQAKNTSTEQIVLLNRETINLLQERLAVINNLLESDRFNEQLRKEKSSVLAFVEQLQIENQTLQNPQSTISSVQYTVIDLENEVAPNFSIEKSSIENNRNLSTEEKQEQVIILNKKYLSQLDKELLDVRAKLSQGEDSKILITKEKIIIATQEKLKEELAKTVQLELNSTEVSIAKLKTEIAPTYEAQKRDIEKKINPPAIEKIQLLNKADTEYVNALQAEIAKVLEKLQGNPDDKELRVKQKLIEDELRLVETAMDERNEELARLKREQRAATEDETVLLNNLQQKYFEDYSAIESNDALNEESKLIAFQKLDKHLSEEVDLVIGNLQWKILEDPSNVEVMKKMEVAEKILIDKRNDIENRAVELKTLQESNESLFSISNNELLSDTTLFSIDSKEDAEIGVDELTLKINQRINSKVEQQRIENKDTNLPENEKQRQLIGIEISYLKELEKELAQHKKALKKDDKNKTLANEVTIISTMVEEQKNRIALISDPQNSIDNSTNKVVVELYPAYENEIKRIEKLNLIDKYEQLLSLESELQQIIESEIATTQVLESSPEQEKKLAILNKAYTKSIARSNELKTKQKENQLLSIQEKIDEEEFVSEIRQLLLKENVQVMAVNNSELDDLRLQDQQLKRYNEGLEVLKSSKEKELTKTNSIIIQQEIGVIKSEIEAVQQKRREVSVSIGEIEQSFISTANSDSESILKNLEERNLKLTEQLQNSELTVAEKRQIAQERNEIANKKTSIENPILEKRIANNDSQIDVIKEKLINPSGEKELVNAQKEANELLKQAEKSKTATAKNYLLKEAEKKQEDALSKSIDLAIEHRISELEKENAIVSIQTKEQLEEKQRKVSIEIGELNQELIQEKKQRELVKQKDKLSFDQKIDRLEKRLAVLNEQQVGTESKILEIENAVPVIDLSALNVVVSFEDEFEIATQANYSEYAKTANEIIQLENDRKFLETKIAIEKQEISRLITEEVTNSKDHSYKIQQSAAKVKQFSVEVGVIENQLVEKEKQLERQAPNNSDEEMKFKNLVLRGVNPIQKVIIATALVPLPASGIEIHKANESSANNTPIAIGVSAPSGLVYRVQVGAFARPIPEELFKEFTPVSGELIANTNITRYMAGYFNNSQKVVSARDEIKTLGYSDAFVVAYCDGKRIPFGEARELERTGRCIAKGENELMLEVAQNTAKKLGLTDTVKHRVASTAYNQAPGAAKAEAIEEIKGLFFTVQIAVHNKPVASAQLLNIAPLITLRLPNGQIRYSTGVYQDYNAAVVKQNEVRAKGILDAFVTAYYNGERIGWQKGMAMLEQQGKNVLANSTNGVVQIENKIQDKVVQNSAPIEIFTPKKVTNQLEKTSYGIQIVSKKTFIEYPREVLNRYNAKGNFYYDYEDGKVKSAVYESENRLPNIHAFKNDIDTIYLSKAESSSETLHSLRFKIAADELPGDLADWLLKVNHRKEIDQSQNGLEIRIFVSTKVALEELIASLAVFNLEIEIQQKSQKDEVELGEGN